VEHICPGREWAGEEGEGVGDRGRGDPNNVYTYELMYKQYKKQINKKQYNQNRQWHAKEYIQSLDEITTTQFLC
jgi:hypothetical protein